MVGTGSRRTSPPDRGVRIQKVLSAAGIASRRGAEDLIRQGRVTVNEKIAVLGQRVEPSSDLIRVDDQRVPSDSSKRYLMLNKPQGVITTRSDPRKRPTVLDLVEAKERVYPIGRLDAATEGLLLLTNDGELAHRLAHPSFDVDKIYVAEVDGHVDPKTVAGLVREGVHVDASGRRARAEKVRVIGARRRPASRTVVEITIHEGRKHVVRKMLERSGHPVRRLVRTAIGPLRLGRLRPGEHRDLTPAEVASLYRAVGL